MQRQIVYYLILAFAALFLVKCSDGVPIQAEDETIAKAESCTLVGNWSRCISNGAASARIGFVANGRLISQKTDSFLASPDCSGPPDGESVIDIHYTLGAYGKSGFVEGGTDVDLTSSADLGCGSDKTVYSVIKFNKDCSEFFPVQLSPGCRADSRGVILDTVPFVRE